MMDESIKYDHLTSEENIILNSGTLNLARRPYPDRK